MCRELPAEQNSVSTHIRAEPEKAQAPWRAGPTHGPQIIYFVGGKLLFDFLHILRDVILLLESVLGRKQPGQHVLQGCLIAVQVHVHLGDGAGGVSPGAPVLLLRR